MALDTLAHVATIPIISLPKDIFGYPPFPLSQFLKLPKTTPFEIPNTILGKQAEAIFETLLQHCPSLTIIAANAQINQEKETIGELDYLLQNKETGDFYHVELACKFYLFDDAHSDIYQAKWIGSNRKDTLHDKLEKLANKQFPLLKHPATQPLLKQLGIKVEKVVQYQYITSSFFIPKEMPVAAIPKAYQSCVVGRWQHYKDVILCEDSLYAIPSKKEWLLPTSCIHHWVTASQARKTLTEYMNQRRAPMVYEKKKETVSKFFVVWWNMDEKNKTL